MSQPTVDAPLTAAGRASLRVRQLVVVFAPEAGGATRAMLEGPELVLGREPEGAQVLRLLDGGASRIHARVLREDGEDWSIVDAGSRNGMLVDGVRVDRAPLVHGTVIRIGRTLLVSVDTVVGAADRLEPAPGALIGGSLAMQRVRGEIATAAPHPVPVLVLGETGTGKELVARAVHERSRRPGAFVAVNCAAIAEQLAESELFGHAAGAFTGARERHDGLFVAADRGTLFLDEVGELSPSVQAKLLRVLADGEVRGVGQTAARKVDVRVVAATWRDLAAGAASAAFREDLLARLSAWTIALPPLRARREDVLALAESWLDGAALTASAAEALLLHGWPRNVRELEQEVHAARLRGGVTLGPEHLSPAIAARVLSRDAGAGATTVSIPLTLRVPPELTPSADDLRIVLAHFRGNVLKVAEYFSRDRRQVYRWLEDHAIDPAAFRGV